MPSRAVCFVVLLALELATATASAVLARSAQVNRCQITAVSTLSSSSFVLAQTDTNKFSGAMTTLLDNGSTTLTGICGVLDADGETFTQLFNSAQVVAQSQSNQLFLLNNIETSAVSTTGVANVVPRVGGVLVTASSSTITLSLRTLDTLVTGETDRVQVAVSSATAFTYITTSSCSQLTRATPRCDISLPVASVTTSASFTFEMSDALGGSAAVVVTVTRVSASPVRFAVVFDNAPEVTSLEGTNSFLSSGGQTVSRLSARIRDLDPSANLTSGETLAYSWSIDTVSNEAASSVVTVGGGTTCPSSWLAFTTGLQSATLPISGEEVALAADFTPTLTPQMTLRYCRINLAVTSNSWTRTKSIVVSVGTSGSITNAPLGVHAIAVQALPLRSNLGLTALSAKTTTADKCYYTTCASETQCFTASTCDVLTGECNAQQPKTGASCNDNDITTRDDTCSSAGVCIGTPKCTGVVCTALTACHDAGQCQPATGLCSLSLPKVAGGSCDDSNPLTKFDTCNANGQCVGFDVSQQVGAGVTYDFTHLAGTPLESFYSNFEVSVSNSCCHRASNKCCSPCTAACGAGTYRSIFVALPIV